MGITVIGDVHGRFDSYKSVIQNCDHSVQIGDMGFNYIALRDVDPLRHRFFGGNHDNYKDYDDVPHALGHYGVRIVNDVEFFFVRGAFSVDIAYRLAGDHGNMSGYDAWFHQEELKYSEMVRCQSEYGRLKPKIVFSHTAPQHMIRDNFNTDLLIRLGLGHDFVSNTSDFLQRLFEIHQPDLWVFGHFHKNVKDTINGTEFVCLPELGTLEI